MARVAVVTMKVQMRGRIRREVRTLLESGHEVLLIGRASDADFLQGLDHPRLSVQLLRPMPLYQRVIERARALLRSRRREAIRG